MCAKKVVAKIEKGKKKKKGQDEGKNRRKLEQKDRREGEINKGRQDLKCGNMWKYSLTTTEKESKGDKKRELVLVM